MIWTRRSRVHRFWRSGFSPVTPRGRSVPKEEKPRSVEEVGQERLAKPKVESINPGQSSHAPRQPAVRQIVCPCFFSSAQMANAESNRRSGETLAGAVPGDCCCKTGIETHLRAYAPAKRADRSSQVDILPGFGRLRQQNRCGNFGFHSRFGGSRFQRKQIGGAQRLDPFADRGPRDRLYWRGQGIILVFLDARSLPDGENLQADICIIGGGPAGIALATTLSKAGIRVVLAESGGLEPDPATQALNDGESTGLGYRINQSRLRYFGGAGNHWAGNCRPLDSIGFAARDWLPHSGWPFGRSVL